MERIRIYDNQGKTIDRYTVVFLNRPAPDEKGTYRSNGLYDCLSMSTDALSPRGICQHGTAKVGAHHGTEIDVRDLPDDCQRAILYELIDDGGDPPEGWEECGSCSGYHPEGFTGDCRDDNNRWP